MSAPSRAPTRPPVERRTIAGRTVHFIQAGWLRLDGGAMFGVVPKTLWERRIPADERNRIPMGMRCLLIEHDVGPILVDTGSGSKESAKFHDIYGIENQGTSGSTWLEDGIREVGFTADDIVLVINTHLHFDHAGGNTVLDADGRPRASFPNARYVVQSGEYGFATHTNERTGGSYFPANYVPLHEDGRLDLVDGEREIVDGITVVPTPGHVPHHQSIVLEGDDGITCYLGDLVPTAHHLPLPWIMGYDVEPLVTLESKRRLLERADADRWQLIFEHDADTAMGIVAHDGKAYVLGGQG